MTELNTTKPMEDKARELANDITATINAGKNGVYEMCLSALVEARVSALEEALGTLREIRALKEQP